MRLFMSRVTKLHPTIVTNNCHHKLVSGEILYIEITRLNSLHSNNGGKQEGENSLKLNHSYIITAIFH